MNLKFSANSSFRVPWISLNGKLFSSLALLCLHLDLSFGVHSVELALCTACKGYSNKFSSCKNIYRFDES